jgi:hypothetical protein
MEVAVTVRKEDPNRAFRLLNALMSWQDIEVNLASTYESNKIPETIFLATKHRA